MVSPELIGGAVIVVAIGAAAAYSYLTGEASSVDIDGDDDPEVTFGDTDLTAVSGIGPTRAVELREAGYETVEAIEAATDEELAAVKGLGEASVQQIRESLDEG